MTISNTHLSKESFLFACEICENDNPSITHRVATHFADEMSNLVSNNAFLKEIYQVRVDNGQNKIFVLSLLFLKYLRFNLKKFLKTGDRSEFMKILPNDTYIIPQTTASIILSNVGTVNTFLTLLNLYLQIMQFQIEKSG